MTFVDYYRYFIYKRKQDANEWDRTRTLMSYILNTQVEKKHKKKRRRKKNCRHASSPKIIKKTELEKKKKR